MTFTQLNVKYISMCDSHTRPKITAANNNINMSYASGKQKTRSQTESEKSRKKIQAQTELTEQQRKESENLKAAQTTRASPQQLAICGDI